METRQHRTKSRTLEYQRRVAALKMTVLMFTMMAILIWAAATAYAQAPLPPSQFEDEKPLIEGDFSSMTTDGNGNIYTVGLGEEIRLYNSNGELQFRYSNNRLGSVGHVDASNPLSILVFYPEYSTAVLLNNTLSEYGRLDLRRQGLTGVRAAGLARDGNVWIYDPTSFQLVKLDKKGSVIRKSEPLNYVLNQELDPVQVMERNRRVYLHDPMVGILVFDEFGTFDYLLAERGLDRFSVIKDVIKGWGGDSLYHWDRRNYEEYIQVYAAGEAPSIVTMEHLYWLKEPGIYRESTK